MRVLGAVFVLAAFPAGHPDSLSHSRLVVRGAEAHLELRFQTLSLIEVLPEVDSDRDLRLSEQELREHRDAIGSYLLERYRLLDPERETLVPGQVDSLALSAEELEPGSFPPSFQWMDARLRFQAPQAFRTFRIDCRLFLEANPFHRDFATVVFNGEEPVRHVFSAESPRWRFDPAGARRPGVFGLFLRLGIEHILHGYDHLAFVLVLFVAVARLRGLVGVVTAFTLAHSITLAGAALDPGGFLGRIPDRFVELAIALSIAYVASENLFLREPHTPWLEAFGFGLLHGLGFASFLGDALAEEPLVVTALFGFNVGVELGQLLVVTALALIFLPARLLRRNGRATEKPAGIVPRWLRIALSSLVLVLALYWFVERAGWIG